MHVGRNDPCPCGGGEKYKRCCLGWEAYFVPSSYPISEGSFLRAPLEASESFRAFMEAERHRISDPVKWFWDPSISAATKARVTSVPTKRGWIHQVRFHAPPARPVDVAHELSHLLVNADGVATAYSTRAEGDDLGAALAGIPSHPKVHAYLYQYGFDLAHLYDEEVAVDIRKLEQIRSEPDDRATLALWALNFAKIGLMRRQVVELGIYGSEDRFDSYVGRRFPIAHAAAVGVLSEIDRFDLSKLDDQERMLHALIQQLGLPTELLVVVKTPWTPPQELLL